MKNKTANSFEDGVYYSEIADEIIVIENGKLTGKWGVLFALENSFLSGYSLYQFIKIGDL